MQLAKRTGLTACLCFSALPIFAQAPRSGGGGASQQITQQYQQLAGEKTELEAQVASLKHDLDSAHVQLDSLKKERDALKARSSAASTNAAELAAVKQAADKSAEQAKQRMDELVNRFRQTANELKQVETDRDRMKGELQDRSADYDKCAADNFSLFEINGEILNRYEHVGLFTKASAAEPFTGITRNRIENLVDEYRARALELRVKSGTGGVDQAGGKVSPAK